MRTPQMAFLTTNPSPFLINVPELQNVITSASGSYNATTTSLGDLLTYIDTTNATTSINTIKAYNATTITVTNDLNLSNAGIYINDYSILGSNALNGIPFMALQANGSEKARVTTAGFAVAQTVAAAPLDVNGATLVRNGSLYISSMGAAITSTVGNAYIDGTVFAGGVAYPSDPALKRNVRPYVPPALPAVYEYEWIATGARDVGVLASEVAAIEPTCVQHTARGMAVDYPKLVVLCMAEIHRLRDDVHALQSTVSALMLQ
jgi:hypothetical protein